MGLGRGGGEPGPVAPDGSPIEFYRLLPEAREADIVHGAIPSGCAILELGSGAGRMTHRLIELGHPVVAVDNSPEMLAHVRGAETVVADIEGLDLDRTFPAVVLASYLVNTPDPVRRRAFLDTCARHLSQGGSVLVQRASPDVHWKGKQFHESTTDQVHVRTRILKWEGNTFHAVAEYRIGERVWTQDYWSELLDDVAIRAALAQSGLAEHRWLDERHEWIQAGPASSRSADSG